MFTCDVLLLVFLEWMCLRYFCFWCCGYVVMLFQFGYVLAQIVCWVNLKLIVPFYVPLFNPNAIFCINKEHIGNKGTEKRTHYCDTPQMLVVRGNRGALQQVAPIFCSHIFHERFCWRNNLVNYWFRMRHVVVRYYNFTIAHLGQPCHTIFPISAEESVISNC